MASAQTLTVGEKLKLYYYEKQVDFILKAIIQWEFVGE